jgi:hypothetical protein
MQFNYQNVKVEEKNPDFRNYGLLNKNLIDDEQELESFLFKSMQDKLRITEDRNKMLEDLNDKLSSDLKVMTSNSAYLETELMNTKKKLENAERAVKILMEKSRN